ncbi:alpha/beta hydrolase [Domibacillus sp. 8LH]|uniref:alpha/beta hydrolase n=1 Tax=Domibacillus sp. 8LH TaxID=3073900 RepID=UPI00316DD4F9
MNKKLLAAFGTAALVLILVSTIIFSSGAEENAASNGNAQEENEESAIQAETVGTSKWDKTFPKSDEVTHKKVSFDNRLGIELVADMYVPKDIDTSAKLPAIIVGHPFGGVKEQTSGLYAQEMAERGFVTIAFDASYNGESGGEPRNIASPEAFVEDFSAAVDFLGTHDLVDRDRIGVIGVCGSGGFTINAAQADPRLKAVATVSMYDMGRANREGLGLAPVADEVMTEEEWRAALEEAAEQRWIEAEGGEPIQNLVGSAVELKPSQEAAAAEFAEYYGTPRGQHPRSVPMSLTSRGALMNFFPFEQIETISPRPMLFIAGENAHSRYYSEDAYELAGEEKELYIVPDAGHVDLYDNMELIPFDKLESFFQENLSRKN